MPPKKKSSNKEQRRMRTQQIILGVVGILIILAMVLGMVVNY